MPGRPEPVGRERVADLAQRVLGRGTARAAVHDLRAELLATETGVLLGLSPAQAVVDMERAHPVAERAEDVPEAGRVGAAGDEAGDLAARPG